MKILFLILGLFRILTSKNKISAESDKGVVKANPAGQTVTYNNARFAQGMLG